MNFNILFFASLRETLQCSQKTLISESAATVADIVQLLKQQGPHWQTTLDNNPVLIAVNQTVGNLHTTVHDGDEIAFYPPVTGG